MSVLAELERLQQQRVAHADAIKKIDDELERVRLAVGLPAASRPRVLPPSAHYTMPYASQGGSIAQGIRAALEAKQPQTAQELADAIGRARGSVYNVCRSLVEQERLVSTPRGAAARGRGKWKEQIYSLGRVPIQGDERPFAYPKDHSTPSASTSIPRSTDAAGSIADLDSMPCASASLAETHGSMPTTATNGQSASSADGFNSSGLSDGG